MEKYITRIGCKTEVFDENSGHKLIIMAPMANLEKQGTYQIVEMRHGAAVWYYTNWKKGSELSTEFDTREDAEYRFAYLSERIRNGEGTFNADGEGQ